MSKVDHQHPIFFKHVFLIIPFYTVIFLFRLCNFTHLVIIVIILLQIKYLSSIYKMSRFGTGSNSNGQFWYGNTTNFPGFLYKKNVGVGGRRSTKFNPGGNITCNSETYLYNKYKPGTGGVGASTTANRRAKNRSASVCIGNNSHCGPFYQYLGRYDKYTGNPNGYFPYPQMPGEKTGIFISPATNYPR